MTGCRFNYQEVRVSYRRKESKDVKAAVQTSRHPTSRNELEDVKVSPTFNEDCSGGSKWIKGGNGNGHKAAHINGSRESSEAAVAVIERYINGWQRDMILRRATIGSWMDDNFDATAGLVFEAAAKVLQKVVLLSLDRNPDGIAGIGTDSVEALEGARARIEQPWEKHAYG
ncbi:hypothetical protein BJV77DRAFT_1149992 [Russula vinacea]|nr:hypothetical protein BJV77DRAFT_1149992 [Russula vinacea]